MSGNERWLLIYSAAALAAVLLTFGIWLRGLVAKTLRADEKVHVAFLDLALRDRSRYLAETLRPAREDGRWPEDLSAVLTRNHADYNRDIFMQVFETDGTLVAASSNAPGQIGLSAETRQRGPAELRWMSSEIRDASRRPVRLVTYPIYSGDPNEASTRALGFAQAGLFLPDTGGALATFTLAMWTSLTGCGAIFLAGLWAIGQAAVRRLKRDSDQLQAAQHRFIADAAHELGTPLAIVQGEIDIALRRERSEEVYRETLRSCREEIERLSRLCDNLLTLASADSGAAMLHLEPGDAAELARQVHRRFSTLASERQIRFQLESPESVPWLADAMAVEQVLGNLIGNAFRHTPAHESVVLKVTDASSSVCLTVEDTGEGIPANHLPLVFRRFHRVDKARTRARGGAGLGLAIVEMLVKAHGGEVSIESRIGKGTAVRCVFPKANVPGQLE